MNQLSSLEKPYLPAPGERGGGGGVSPTKWKAALSYTNFVL